MTGYLITLCLYLVNCLVTSGLEVVLQPSTQVGAVGKPLWWHCRGSGGQGPLTYRWRHNDAFIVADNNIQVLANGTLHIASLTDQLKGQYRCVVADGQTNVYSREGLLTLAYIADSFTSSPSHQTGNVGDTIIMTCAIVSTPPAIFTWLLDQQPVTKGTVTVLPGSGICQYKIENVDFYSNGEYVCKARNPLSGIDRYSNTGSLRLEGKPSFKVSPSPQSVPEGRTAMFDCQGIALPMAISSWLDVRDGNNIKEIQTGGRYVVYSNGSLHISLVTSGDQGYYRCLIRNSWGEDSKTVLLTVTGPVSGPQFTMTAQDTTVFEAASVMFQCSASGVPTPQVSWWKENGDLPPTRTQYPFDGAIRIINVQVSDVGTYTCRASNALGSVTHRVKLTVQVGPSFTVMPQDITTRENKAIELQCQAQGTPQPTMNWRLPNSKTLVVPSGIVDGVYVRANGSLVIRRIERIHHGQYKCIATNPVSTATAAATVNVQLPPSFTSMPDTQTVLEGERVVFQCTAEGRPLPIILWYKVGNSLPIQASASYEIFSNGSLILPYVRKMHEGIYRCEAKNLISTIETIVSLTVNVPPSFQVLPRDLMVAVGDDVQIECVAAGHPQPTVTWQYNGQTIVLEDNMKIHPNNTIQITGLRSSQIGTYTCIAENSVGKHNVEAELYKYDQPIFVVLPANSTGNLGETLTMRCSASARDQPSYKWYRSDSNGGQGSEVTQGSNIIVMSSGDLIFQSLKQANEGWYLCRAINRVSSVSAHAFLNVQVPPVITDITPSLTVPVGGAAVLSCTTTGDPAPTLTWMTPDGTPASSRDYNVSGKSLTILSSNVKIHWGGWTCRACNLLGCVNDTIRLQIEGKPALLSVTAVRLKHSLLIHCDAVGTPTPKMRYYIGPTEIRPDLPPIGHIILPNRTLQVQETEISNTYQCIATNVFGGDFQPLTVPSAPSTPVFTNVQSTSMTVAWSNPAIVPPITGHVLQYRLTSASLWTSVETGPYALLTVKDLDPYLMYVFRVKAVNAIGGGVYSNITAVQEALEGAPTEPLNVMTTVTDNTIEVSWEHSAQMNGDVGYLMYEIYYKRANTSDQEIVIQHSTSTAVILHNLHFSTMYIVRVRAGNTRAGMWSEFVIRTVSVFEMKPQSVPTGVTAVASAHDEILVKWNPVVNDTVVGYLVAFAEMKERIYTVVTVNSNSHLITGVNEKTTYLVRVAAYNRGGNGTYSSLVQVETPIGPAEPQRLLALSDGAIGGIAAGCAGFLLLILLITIICVQQRRLSKMESMSLDADDEFSKHSMRQNFYANDINTATVNSAKSGIRGFYDLGGRNNDAFDGELSTDTAYTLGPNNTALPLRIRPLHDSDVMFKEQANPDVLLISRTPRQEFSPNDTTPELQAVRDLDFELDEIMSPEDYLEPSSFHPQQASSPARSSANGHIYSNDDSMMGSTPRSGPHEYAEVRDGQVRTTSQNTNNTSGESGIYTAVDMAGKANRRNKNQYNKVMKKGAKDYNNLNAKPGEIQVSNPMYLPYQNDKRDTMQSNFSRDSIGSSLPGNSSLGNIMDGSLYDTPIRESPLHRSNSIGRGQPMHMEESIDEDYGWENDSETEERNALSY